MTRNFLLFVFFASFMPATPITAQNLWDSPQAFLGQARPGSKPVRFAPKLIDDAPFFSMDRCAFSKDGKEFYYVRNNTWFNSKDASIRQFRFDGKHWVGPTMVKPLYYAPTLSTDDSTIYFLGGGGGTVLQSRRNGQGWGPVDTFLRRSYGLYDFMPANSGNMYAASNINGPVGNYNCYDICLMHPLSSGDTGIYTLGKPLNTPGFDGDFFVAPDESYIIISAKEQPDFECELFISYHKQDGTWTNPKSLGAAINNGPAHRWGEYVSPDGRYLFYSYGHSPKDCALYWVRFDNLLEKLRHTNFEPYVKDSIAAQNTGPGQPFSLKIGDSVFYDDDGMHTLHLSAGLSNGAPLPAWLRFDAKEGTLTGTPGKKGSYKIKVVATDPSGTKASSTFLLNVN